MHIVINKVDAANRAMEELEKGELKPQYFNEVLTVLISHERNLTRILGSYEAMQNWRRDMVKRLVLVIMTH